MTASSRRSVRCVAAVAAALLLAVAACLAVPVNPSECVDLMGTTAAARPELAGVVLRDDLEPYEIYDDFGNLVSQGQVQCSVQRSATRGTVIVTFRIRDTDPTLPGSIIAAYWTGFREGPTIFLADAEYRLDGLGSVGPAIVCRSDDGDALYFDFSGEPVTPGDESRFVFVLTDTTTFEKVGTLTLFADDLSSTTIPCYAPRVVP